MNILLPRNYRSHCARLLISICVAIAGGGCVTGGPGSDRAAYGWIFFKDTDAEINSVYLTYKVGTEGRDPGVGVLPAHGIGEWVYATDVIPKSGVLNWLGADGARHRQVVGIASSVPDPSQFSGSVCFRLQGDVWEVIPLTREEDRQILQGSEVKGMRMKTRE